MSLVKIYNKYSRKDGRNKPTKEGRKERITERYKERTGRKNRKTRTHTRLLL
jgi:hypothetical protein